jgi:hypothetical protein
MERKLAVRGPWLIAGDLMAGVMTAATTTQVFRG